MRQKDISRFLREQLHASVLDSFFFQDARFLGALVVEIDDAHFIYLTTLS